MLNFQKRTNKQNGVPQNIPSLSLRLRDFSRQTICQEVQKQKPEWFLKAGESLKKWLENGDLSDRHQANLQALALTEEIKYESEACRALGQAILASTANDAAFAAKRVVKNLRDMNFILYKPEKAYQYSETITDRLISSL